MSVSKTTLLLKSKFILYNKQYSHGEQQGERESAFQWQVVAFHWVIGVLPLGLFGNCGKPGTVLQSEALVDSESKDPLVIKLSAYTSSDKGRRELGNHKHILVPWFCSGWNHSNDEFMLVEHWSGDFINFFLYFFSFIFISWRLITLQYYTEWSKPER